MAYAVHLLTMVSFYMILALALDLVIVAGLMSLAIGAFFGVGAYTSALLSKAGVAPLLAQFTGMALAALLSGFVALPAARVRGIYLLIITIAVQIVSTVILQNWTAVTGGDAGIPHIPPYSVFGVEIRGAPFLVVSIVSALAVYLVCRGLARSPFGAMLKAIRDDETGALALGKNVVAAKLWAFALSGALAAFAGSLYAHYTAYVDPGSFDINVSILVLLMVMLGGAGTLRGPVAGAVVLSIVPEIFKFLPLPPGVAAATRQLLYGVLLLVVVYWRPQGLFGGRPVTSARPRNSAGAPPAQVLP